MRKTHPLLPEKTLSDNFSDAQWYHTVDDFLKEADLDEEHITTRHEKLYDFEVVGWS